MNAMVHGSECLTEELLSRLTLGDLHGPELARVEDHVGDCERCSDLLDSSAMDEDWRDRVLPVLREPLEPYHPDGEVASDGEDGHRDEATHASVGKLLGPTDDPNSMGRVGPYEVVGVIGRGGMGVVFKALDPALNRYVAIKMLLPHLAAAGAARKRFAREAQAAAAVIDDHVMPIHSVAEWQGLPYLVTPYSRGTTLQRRIQDRGPLELKEILRIGMQMARGLAAAHAQGLVHRDVKPSNILLDGTVDRALLTDFGLARAVDDASITRTGIIAGTPQYMSPEQASGGPVDHRSDLFGLGSVLYAMCTGRPPFRADNTYAILRLITDKTPTPIREINPDIPVWLAAIIGRLMAKKAEERYATAAEVATLLEKYLAHVQQPNEIPLPVNESRRWGRWSAFFAGGKGGLIMLGMFLLGFAGMLFAQTEPPDIAGDWSAAEWGNVQLKQTGAGIYEGNYSETNGGEPGVIALRWSRIECRFNGTWNEGKGERFGDISLRLVGEKIQGAFTTDKGSRINPETPRIGDLVWARGLNQPDRSLRTPAAATTSPIQAKTGPVHGTTGPLAAKKLTLSFDRKPWPHVFEWLTNVTDLPVITTFKPSGTFTFLGQPGQLYSIPEVIDIINEALFSSDEMQKFYLIRRERSFTLISADEKEDGLMRSRLEVSDLESRRDTEIVQVIMPLKTLVAKELAPEVKKLLGPFGEVVVLDRSNQLMLSDTVGNLKRIYKLVKAAENKDGKFQADRLTYECKYVKARAVEVVLKELLSDPKTLNSATALKQTQINPGSELPIPSKSIPFSLSVDDRTNTIVVTGSAEKIVQALEVLQIIDRGSPIQGVEAKAYVVGPLRYIFAQHAANTIQAAYKDFTRDHLASSDAKESRSIKVGAVEKAILRVGVDSETNSLWLYCSQQLHKEISKLVEYMEEAGKTASLPRSAALERPAGNANQPEKGVYRPQLKGVNADEAFQFLRELMALMNLSIDVSVHGNGQFSFHRNPNDDYRWLERAKSVALVLEGIDPALGDAGPRKYRENCLTLIDELIQHTRHEKEMGEWVQGRRNKSGKDLNDPRHVIDPEALLELFPIEYGAKSNLDAWNSSSGIETLAPRNDPNLSVKVNAVRAFLKPFGVNLESVDRIIARGVVDNQSAFPRKDGRQRVISLLVFLKEVKRPDGVGLPPNEGRALLLARLEVLETLRLVLTKENAEVSSASGAREIRREEVRSDFRSTTSSVENSQFSAPGGFWPLLKRADWPGFHGFTKALGWFVPFTLEIHLGNGSDLTLKCRPTDDPRSLKRAWKLAQSLAVPDPREGEAGRRKHRDDCLEFLGELKETANEQMEKEWQDRIKKGAKGSPAEVAGLRDNAMQMARSNLDVWNQLDQIETPTPKSDTQSTGKTDAFKGLLLPIFADKAVVDRILAKGMAEGQFSFPRSDGRQRLLSQLAVLMEAEKAERKNLPLEEWKSLQIARLEVLETLRLVLTRENEIADRSGGLLGPARKLTDDAVARSRGQDRRDQQLTDPMEGVWEVDLPKSLQELPPDKQPYLVVLADPSKSQGTQPALWYGMYMGRERQSASRFNIDKNKGSFSMEGPARIPIRGLYDVRSDRLSMCYVRLPQELPKTIEPGQGRELHDFKRIKGIVAETLLGDLRDYVKKAKWEEELFQPKTSSSKNNETSRLQARSQLVLDDQVERWAISPDGRRVAVALRLKGEKETGKPFVDIFDLNSKKLEVKLKVTAFESEKENGAAQKKLPTPFELTALAFSPDGKTIAVGSSIGQVYLFDAATGRFAFTLEDKRSAATSSNGASQTALKPASSGASGAKPLVAESKEGQTKNTPTLAMQEVASLAFSPDGATLAVLGSMMEIPQSNSSDSQGRTARKYLMPGRVMIWNLKDRTVLCRLDDSVQVQQLAISSIQDASGKRTPVLATLGKWSEGGKLRHGTMFWKLEDGTRVGGPSLDGASMASPSAFSWEVGVLEENQDKPNSPSRVRALSNKNPEMPLSIAFSQDGALLAIAHGQRSDGSELDQSTTIRLIGANRGPIWGVLEPNGAQVLGVTSDGKGIIILSAGLALRILDAASGKVSEEYRISDIRKGGKWNHGAILPQGNLVALKGVDQVGRATIDLIDLDGLRKQPVSDRLPTEDSGADLSGKWIDESKAELGYSIRKVENSKTEILVTSDFGLEEKLTWSPLAKRYEGSGQLTGGERYRIFVTPIPGGQKLAVAWNFDEAWREKWFQHKAPRFPQIAPELLQSLQKEYDEQFQRVWIQEKPGANRKPPFDPLVEQPW